MRQKLRALFGAERQEFNRLINDWRLCLSIVLYVVVCVISVRQFTNDSVTNSIEMIIGLSNMNKLLVIISTFPCALSFCDDWNNNYIRSVLVRCGEKSYLLTKMITCIISAFTVSLIGMLLFSLVMFSLYPFDRGTMNNLYSQLIGGTTTNFLYILIRCVLFSLVVTISAAFGMAISSILPNKFVSIVSPLLASFILEDLTMFNVPVYLNTYKLQNASNVFHSGMLQSFLLTLCIILGYILIAWLIFRTVAGRRIRNEIV